MNTRRSGDPVTATGYITITTDDQCFWYFLMFVKKLEKFFDHGLSVCRVISLLPQEQRYTQGGRIASAKNITRRASIVGLFERAKRKGRQGPVGHSIAGGMAESGAGIDRGIITSGARVVRIILSVL